LVARDSRRRLAGEDITTITRFLKAPQSVIAAATEGLVPNLIAAGIQLHHPVITYAISARRFIARYVGVRPSANDVASIAGLLNTRQQFVIAAAKRIFPDFVTIDIQLQHPVIKSAI